MEPMLYLHDQTLYEVFTNNRSILSTYCDTNLSHNNFDSSHKIILIVYMDFFKCHLNNTNSWVRSFYGKETIFLT